MRIDDEYRLQTADGAEWEQAYQTRLAAIRDDAGRMNRLRTERLAAAVDAELGGLRINQGTSKTARRHATHWGQDEPSVSEGDVPVWIRDEWSVTVPTVRRSAAEAGDESPIVFVLLPKIEPDQIKNTLAGYAAAEDTLRRPTPQTDEGRAAQRAMRTRLATADEQLGSLFQAVVARTRVYQGGSGSELTISTLRAAVETAAGRSLIRLFPKFDVGDHVGWPKVVTKARDGDPAALEAVGHHGEFTTNAVCKEVLAAVSAGGTKGTDLHKRFAAPPYGWGKDAVNGAVMALFAAGNIRAVQDGKDLAGPKELTPNKIGQVVFYKQDEPPGAAQRIQVRGLLGAAGIPYEAGQESAQISALLQLLKDLAAGAGGPPPLPAPPDPDHLDALLALAGNQRFRAVADDVPSLRENLDRWQVATQQRSKREAQWQRLQWLLRHASDLPVAAQVTPAVDAIRDGRQLLDDLDPVAPLLSEVTTALRNEIRQRAAQLAAAQRDAVAELEAWSEWPKLGPGDRDAVVADAKLVPAEPPDIATDAMLLEALDGTQLGAWTDRIGLVPSRRDQARQRAAKQLEPESVEVPAPRATIKTPDDLTRYLNDLRAQVMPHLDAGKTVIL